MLPGMLRPCRATFCSRRRSFFVPSLSLADWLRLRLDRWVRSMDRSIDGAIEPRSIADRRSAGPGSVLVFQPGTGNWERIT